MCLSDLELSYLKPNKPLSLEFLLLTLPVLRPDYVQETSILTCIFFQTSQWHPMSIKHLKLKADGLFVQELS